MARKLRLEFPGACYHVINRGNYRADVFETEGARAAFRQCLFAACAKSGWVLHAFVIIIKPLVPIIPLVVDLFRQDLLRNIDNISGFENKHALRGGFAFNQVLDALNIKYLFLGSSGSQSGDSNIVTLGEIG